MKLPFFSKTEFDMIDSFLNRLYGYKPKHKDCSKLNDHTEKLLEVPFGALISRSVIKAK